jgi:hypothetical protein
MELIDNNVENIYNINHSSEENTQLSVLSSESLAVVSVDYSDNEFTNKHSLENEEGDSSIDYMFSALFIGLPITIAAITGAISGKAISRSDCCINCMANNIDSIIENYILSTADYTFINQPYSTTDNVNYLITIVPNIMKAITALSTVGLSVGSFWYDLKNENSLYQHVITLTSTAVVTPIVFYMTESYTSTIQDNIHYAGEGEI